MASTTLKGHDLFMMLRESNLDLDDKAPPNMLRSFN